MSVTWQEPDYTGGGLVNLMASLMRGLGLEARHPPTPHLPPERVAASPRVVLLVIDGLGDTFLRAHLNAGPLIEGRHGPLTSVFPSTTASAVTTFFTGQAPGEHGITGWTMLLPRWGTVASILPGRSRFGTSLYDEGGLAPEQVFDHTPITARLAEPSAVLTPADIANSPYNQVMTRGAYVVPYRDLEDLAQWVPRVFSEIGPRYTYIYWPLLDHLGHSYGMESDQAVRHLQELNEWLARVLETAGPDTLWVVTGDHGQVDQEERLLLQDFPELARRALLPLAGEPRCAYVYLRGDPQEHRLLLAEALGDRAVVRSGEEAIARGWFGPPPYHPELERRIGDFLVLPAGDRIVQDVLPTDGPFVPRGVHGGLSAAEMLVPLSVLGT
jgi:hypothetical protein